MSAHTHDHAAVAVPEVLDPGCGMTISSDDAVGHADHKGQTYYFCSDSCLAQFKEDPERFLAADPAARTGTDVAVESVGVTLVKGDLRGIVRARKLSRNTMRNVRQNLFSRPSTTSRACRLRPESCIPG